MLPLEFKQNKKSVLQSRADYKSILSCDLGDVCRTPGPYLLDPSCTSQVVTLKLYPETLTPS